MVIPRQGEQSPVVIISYLGYSPPKCTCYGKQSHSSNFMNLLKCLHAQTHVPSSHRLPHICLSRMRVKSQFSKQKLFVLENTLPSFSKILDYPPRRICWITLRNNGPLRRELLDNLPIQFSGKLSVEISFTNIFIFVSFHVMHSHLIF